MKTIYVHTGAHTWEDTDGCCGLIACSQCYCHDVHVHNSTKKLLLSFLSTNKPHCFHHQNLALLMKTFVIFKKLPRWHRNNWFTKTFSSIPEAWTFLTQVVINKVSCEGRLLVLPASIHGGVCIRRVHRENVGADAHQLCLPHQLPDRWGTRGQRSRQFFPGYPRLGPGVPGQFCFCPVLLQSGRDSGLQVGETS